jgi:hypothetical protein
MPLNVQNPRLSLLSYIPRPNTKPAAPNRDRRAKIIHAEAEFQASQTLVNAAQVLSSIPAAMQLRYLQTLTEIGAEKNSTVIFPMPIDIIKPFLELVKKDTSVPPIIPPKVVPPITESESTPADVPPME